MTTSRMARAAPRLIKRRGAQPIIGAVPFPAKTRNQLGVAAPSHPEVDDVAPALPKINKRRITVSRFITQVVVQKMIELTARIPPTIPAANHPVGVGRPRKTEPVLSQPALLVAIAHESVRAPVAVYVAVLPVVGALLAQSCAQRENGVPQPRVRELRVALEAGAVETGCKARRGCPQ